MIEASIAAVIITATICFTAYRVFKLRNHAEEHLKELTQIKERLSKLEMKNHLGNR